MSYKITLVDIDKLKLNEKNPRTIKDKKFEELKKSLTEFPKMLQIRPIITDDNFTIIGGNMRYKAAKALGWKQVPTMKASDFTEAELREFVIKDNQEYGDWNWDMLTEENEIPELLNWGFDPTDFDMSTTPAFEEIDGANTDDGIESDKLLPTSNVKMLQLFLTDQTQPEVVTKCLDLEPVFETSNITDTIVKCIEYAHTNLVKKTDTATNE